MYEHACLFERHDCPWVWAMLANLAGWVLEKMMTGPAGEWTARGGSSYVVGHRTLRSRRV